MKRIRLTAGMLRAMGDCLNESEAGGHVGITQNLDGGEEGAEAKRWVHDAERASDWIHQKLHSRETGKDKRHTPKVHIRHPTNLDTVMCGRPRKGIKHTGWEPSLEVQLADATCGACIARWKQERQREHDREAKVDAEYHKQHGDGEGEPFTPEVTTDMVRMATALAGGPVHPSIKKTTYTMRPKEFHKALDAVIESAVPPRTKGR